MQGFKDLGDKIDASNGQFHKKIGENRTAIEVTRATMKTKARMFGVLLTAIATVVSVIGVVLTFIHFLKGG